MLLLGVVSFALVLVPVGITKTPPKQDSVFGSGVRNALSPGGPTPSFSFNAQSGPAGENPSGTFFFDVLGNQFTGTVTCLKVSGHTATLAGMVTVGTGFFDPTVPENGYGAAEYFFATVTDNGKPQKKAPSADTMSAVTNFGQTDLDNAGETFAQVCADPLPFIGTAPIVGLVSGDLTVIDN
jgi:hypothetical protein